MKVGALVTAGTTSGDPLVPDVLSDDELLELLEEDLRRYRWALPDLFFFLPPVRGCEESREDPRTDAAPPDGSAGTPCATTACRSV